MKANFIKTMNEAKHAILSKHLLLPLERKSLTGITVKMWKTTCQFVGEEFTVSC